MPWPSACQCESVVQEPPSTQWHRSARHRPWEQAACHDSRRSVVVRPSESSPQVLRSWSQSRLRLKGARTQLRAADHPPFRAALPSGRARQNVLVDEKKRCLKLADFGLARSYTVPLTPYTHEAPAADFPGERPEGAPAGIQTSASFLISARQSQSRLWNVLQAPASGLPCMHSRAVIDSGCRCRSWH